jgi:hypothetical protein
VKLSLRFYEQLQLDFRLRNGAKTPKRAFFAQSSAFALGRSTPDTELFFVVERVLQTLVSDFALRAHCSRRLGRPTSLGKENLWIDFRTARIGLPVDRLKELVRDPLHPPAFLSPPPRRHWGSTQITLL